MLLPPGSRAAARSWTGRWLQGEASYRIYVHDPSRWDDEAPHGDATDIYRYPSWLQERVVSVHVESPQSRDSLESLPQVLIGEAPRPPHSRHDESSLIARVYFWSPRVPTYLPCAAPWPLGCQSEPEDSSPAGIAVGAFRTTFAGRVEATHSPPTRGRAGKVVDCCSSAIRPACVSLQRRPRRPGTTSKYT